MWKTYLCYVIYHECDSCMWSCHSIHVVIVCHDILHVFKLGLICTVHVSCLLCLYRIGKFLIIHIRAEEIITVWSFLLNVWPIIHYLSKLSNVWIFDQVKQRYGHWWLLIDHFSNLIISSIYVHSCNAIWYKDVNTCS